jgi:hypothetical protein
MISEDSVCGAWVEHGGKSVWPRSFFALLQIDAELDTRGGYGQYTPKPSPSDLLSPDRSVLKFLKPSKIVQPVNLGMKPQHEPLEEGTSYPNPNKHFCTICTVL